MLETHLVPGFSTKMLGKRNTPHTKEAHERYLMSKSLISRLAGREQMVQQLLLLGLALSSIWEKARARDRQREVAGDKGPWGFVLQGMRPAVAQAAEWWQGEVLITKYVIFINLGKGFCFVGSFVLKEFLQMKTIMCSSFSVLVPLAMYFISNGTTGQISLSISWLLVCPVFGELNRHLDRMHRRNGKV
jgi:hypothetical protein